MRALAATLLLVSTPALAAENGRPWLRRLTVAAACAASFWDAQSTAVAVRSGALESNPLFADSSGRPRWGRILGFKAGTCAASFIVQERFAARGRHDRFWIGINTATTGAFSALAVRNLRIAGDSPPLKPVVPAKAGSVSTLTDPTP